MNKRFCLNILIAFSLCFAVVPAVYFYKTAKHFASVNKVKKAVKQKEVAEYFQFEQFNFNSNRLFNGVLYNVQGFAEKTQGLATMQRGTLNEIILDEVSLETLHSNILNIASGIVYNVDSKTVYILKNGEIIQFDDGFKIASINGKEQTNMNGFEIEFDLTKKEVLSGKPVKIWNETSKLVGNDLFCTVQGCVLNGNVFYEMPDVEVESEKVEIFFEEDEKGKRGVESVVFLKKAKLYNKQTNSKAFADAIIFNDKENVAFLKGGAKIVDAKGTVKGEDMTYHIVTGAGIVKGKVANGIERLVEVNFFY